jgi:hypothetical protein
MILLVEVALAAVARTMTAVLLVAAALPENGKTRSFA